MKYGQDPWPDYSHGYKGLIEYYKDYFGLHDVRIILKLLFLVADDKYRGHLLCVCNSGKKARYCHGPLLVNLSGVPKSVIRGDVIGIMEYIKIKNQMARLIKGNNVKKPLNY